MHSFCMGATGNLLKLIELLLDIPMQPQELQAVAPLFARFLLALGGHSV